MADAGVESISLRVNLLTCCQWWCGSEQARGNAAFSYTLYLPCGMGTRAASAASAAGTLPAETLTEACPASRPPG
jgi:hypothetical protein